MQKRDFRLNSANYFIEKGTKLSQNRPDVHTRPCMKEAGVEHDMATHVITNLMQGTITNLANTLSPEASLTGPIKQGGIPTIRTHIASLTNREQQHLYAVLGKATLHLTEHDTITQEKVRRALND